MKRILKDKRFATVVGILISIIIFCSILWLILNCISGTISIDWNISVK